MNVIINNVTYENAEWENNGFIFPTSMTLTEIEEVFVPGTDTTIRVMDGEVEVERYYNKGLSSVTVLTGTPRKVNVQFDLTRISRDAEDEINERMDDSDGAIEELAMIISDMSEIDFDGMTDELRSHQETLNTWFSHASEIGQFIHDLQKSGGILDMFDARITALEHEVGIVSVTMNEEGQENG